jgi:amphiphysin
MKGFVKGIKRTPHMVTTKVGMSKKSSDSEFDDYQRHFGVLEGAVEKLLKDSKAFIEAVISLFTSEAQFAAHFATVFHPMAGELDLIGKHPEATRTLRLVDKYESAMEELRTAISPELELIESRIMAPTKELQGVMKLIRKSITKRDHKLTDYDRFNNSLTKLRDKKEKTLTDEKNLFKLEQDFEIATNEYDYINNALKTDLPRFMTLSSQFIDPLFHSFFYMQLNIFYILLEKLHSFADEGKFDIANIPGAQIVADFEQNRTDAYQIIENFGIVKRIISVSKLVQANRQNNTLGRAPSSASSLGRASSSASAYAGRAPPPLHATPSFTKKPPPPPPLGSKIAPPPYSATSVASSVVAKKPPPPPPPMKPKPKMGPSVQYVVALYDFAAQVSYLPPLNDSHHNIFTRRMVICHSGLGIGLK